MTHPALTRLRTRSEPARARARHILDQHHGTLDLAAPQLDTHSDRDAAELAARQQARDILTSDEVRQRLADLEAEQSAGQLDTLGLTPAETGPVAFDEPTEQLVAELLDELHRSTVIVDVITATPIPTPDPTEQALRALGIDPADDTVVGLTVTRNVDTLTVEPVTVDSDAGQALQAARLDGKATKQG